MIIYLIVGLIGLVIGLIVGGIIGWYAGLDIATTVSAKVAGTVFAVAYKKGMVDNPFPPKPGPSGTPDDPRPVFTHTIPPASL